MSTRPAHNRSTADFVFRPRSLARRCLHYTLHLPVETKALILLVIVLLGSVIHALDLSPYTNFADRNNPVNIYLVKYSWGWTLLVIAPATFFPAVLYSGLCWRTILRHLSRLVVSHLIWLSVTSLIVLLDSQVGTCEDDEIIDRSACIRKGHLWLGFDISGHIFLLTYCIYVITEECANIKLEVWYEYESVLEQEKHVVDKLSPKAVETLTTMHKMTSWLIEPLELLCLTLILIWVAMVVSTSLYFHTFVEKVLGYVCAWLSWYLTYRWLYGKSKYLPCLPSEGYLNPQRIV